LLEPRDALTECVPSSLAVRGLKLGEFQPAETYIDREGNFGIVAAPIKIAETKNSGTILFLIATPSMDTLTF